MTIEHEYTHEPVCPYCGNEQSDSFELPEDGVDDCGYCHKTFTFTSYIHRKFTTKKCPCANGEGQHKWTDYKAYRRCADCELVEEKQI